MSKELNKVMGMVCERERMYYNAAKVDAILAEKDAEIAEFKDKIKIYEDLGSCKKGCPALRHNQRRVIGEIYKVTLKDKEIAELKKKCEAEKSIGATFSKNGAELARRVEELRTEIESLKASHYAEMVDAGMRERRLRRALYKALANWAICKACILEYFCHILNAKKWERMYHKCRAKAEEYK